VDNAYVLDSYALIAHFEDEPEGARVTRLLRASLERKTSLYLSVINLGEICYNTVRERGAEKAAEVLLLIDQLPIRVVDADRPLALEAARLKARHSIAYADCFAAALGISIKAKVVTGDPEFRKLEKVVAIEWLK